MPDITSQVVLDALRRAATDPGGLPLFGQKTMPGLFGAGTSAREAAQKCKELELLRVVRTAARGKSTQEVVVLTPKGLEHLLKQADPRIVLEDLVRALEQRNRQLDAQIDSACAAQATVAAFKELASAALARLSGGSSSQPDALEKQLEQTLTDYKAGGGADCPLPELLRALRQAEPALSIGAFHDALRSAHQRQCIYLHPWTGPLSELPEPAVALLVGHEIAYYASLRPGPAGPDGR